MNVHGIMISVRTSGLVAAAIAGAASAFELVRVIATGGVAHGQTPAATFVQSLTFCAVLGVAAFGLAVHRPLGWIAGIGGFLYALSYGIVLRAGGNLIGIAYMFVGIALFPLLVKALPYYRTGPAAAA